MATEPTGILRIELLGPVRAWWADEELDLGSARTRAVFAFLAMRAGQTVPRHEIIAGVWGADAPDTAGASLDTYVSNLRQALDLVSTRQSGDVLVQVEDGYSLHVDPDVVDVTTFARLRARSATHAERGEFRAVARSLTTALALWSGDALSDISGPFAEVHRARLGEWRLAAYERRAAATLALGGHVQVVAELAELVTAHPRRERLRELLMLAQYRSGRPAEALDSYQSAQIMAEKVGIQPGRALRRLHDRIVVNDPTLDLAAPATRPAPFVVNWRPAVPASATPTPFVGRHQELAVFNARLRALANGQGGAVWVEGKAGIGKSRLLEAALSNSVTREVRLLSGVADELSARSRFRLMTDALQMDPVDVHPWRDADLVLCALERLGAAVDRLCADDPVALVVDDLHRIDCASLMLWHRLIRTTVRQPLLLIGTSRPTPRRAEIDWVRDTVTAVGGDLIRLDAESPLRLKEVVDAGTTAASRRRTSLPSTSLAGVTSAV